MGTSREHSSFWLTGNLTCHSKEMKYILLIICSLTLPTYLAALQLPIKLEHATVREEHQKGLMNRSYLPDGNGMTFNFESPTIVHFWMFRTLIDLSIAFLDENKIILEIYELKAYPEIQEKEFFYDKIVKPSIPIKYALEMNSSWFSRNGIQPGDQAVWNINSPDGWIIKR